VLNLKEAMQAWIQAYGNKHKSLSTDLNKCVDVVLNEIGGTEPGA
jgi:hypothetical protein